MNTEESAEMLWERKKYEKKLALPPSSPPLTKFIQKWSKGKNKQNIKLFLACKRKREKVFSFSFVYAAIHTHYPSWCEIAFIIEPRPKRSTYDLSCFFFYLSFTQGFGVDRLIWRFNFLKNTIISLWRKKVFLVFWFIIWLHIRV